MDDAPLYDVTLNGVYPDDFYSPLGLRYYGTGDSSLDQVSMAVIQSVHNKPKAKVRVYRAVPKILTTKERLKILLKEKADYLKRGKVPNYEDRATYYDNLCEKIDKLQSSKSVSPEKFEINPGDWVTINRQYAIDHGQSVFKGSYRILVKTVTADSLFTNGDSMHEWGYWPS